MNTIFRSGTSLFSGLAFLLFVAIVLIATTGTTKNVSAQSAPSPCKVVIVLDKSASIGDNWTILRNQVQDLFGYGGLNDSNISLAFWTFSQVGNATSTNYNAPYHTYVNSADDGTAFMTSLPANPDDILSGQTNYEQGFGYNLAIPNPSSDLKQIRENANVIAFLTDGLPNYPGGLDNNEAAVRAGQSARNQYGPGVNVIGGFISDTPDYVPLSLYRVVNGNENDHNNVGPLGFGNLNQFLMDRIPIACNTKVQQQNYSIEPKVNVDTSAVKVGDPVKFTYTAENKTTADTPNTSAWKLYDVTIDPSIKTSPLTFKNGVACKTTSGQSYCDSVSNCTDILKLIGGTGSQCSEVPPGLDKLTKCDGDTSPGSGTYGFKPGNNDTNFYPAPRCVTVGDLPIGTQVCSILAIGSPSGDGKSNRISDAGCTTIAKTPLVQVRGGDVRVGRNFDGDTPDIGAGVYTSTFGIRDKESLKVVPNGRTFGSWTEYGILAPGPIKKMASLGGYSGPHGGYDEQVTSGCDSAHNDLNKLTFANNVTDSRYSNECGRFTDTIGSIPDTASALKSGTPNLPNPYSSPLVLSATTAAGLYKNETVGVNFEISASEEIGKGKTYIVYVPYGTVTVASNISYANDGYSAISEIPQLVIIAKNINIKEKSATNVDITRVDAWLIANGTGNDGKIDTCTGYVHPLSANVCNQPLTINGPVMARQLDLWRTKVNLSDCTIKSIDDCRDAGDPAEIINLPGSSILWAQGYRVNPSRAQTSYTIELPPYY